MRAASLIPILLLGMLASCDREDVATSPGEASMLALRIGASEPVDPVDSVAVALVVDGVLRDTLILPYLKGGAIPLKPVRHGAAFEIALVGFEDVEWFQGTGFAHRRVARWGGRSTGIADGTRATQLVEMALQIPSLGNVLASGTVEGDSLATGSDVLLGRVDHPATDLPAAIDADGWIADRPGVVVLARRDSSRFVPTSLRAAWSEFALVWSRDTTLEFTAAVSGSTTGTLMDVRDSKTYKTTTFHGQTWMAENLAWSGVDGKLGSCLVAGADSCSRYGRFYSWMEAMAGSAASDLTPSGVQGICPAGWHLPSDDEWDSLAIHLGGSAKAGDSLKASGAWGSDPSTDPIGFGALPGGRHDPDNTDNYVGSEGRWWTSSLSGGEAIHRDIVRGSSPLYSSTTALSGPYAYSIHVRCVKDPGP